MAEQIDPRAQAVVDKTRPPAGWFAFGSHQGHNPVPALEFYGEDPEDGLPLWERPVDQGDREALAEMAGDLLMQCATTTNHSMTPREVERRLDEIWQAGYYAAIAESAPAPVDQGNQEALLGKVAAALIDRQACADTGKPLTARQYAAAATDAALAWFAAQPKTVTAEEVRQAVRVMMQPRMHTNGAGDSVRASLLDALDALGITVQGGAE